MCYSPYLKFLHPLVSVMPNWCNNNRFSKAVFDRDCISLCRRKWNLTAVRAVYAFSFMSGTQYWRLNTSGHGIIIPQNVSLRARGTKIGYWEKNGCALHWRGLCKLARAQCWWSSFCRAESAIVGIWLVELASELKSQVAWNYIKSVLLVTLNILVACSFFQ